MTRERRAPDALREMRSRRPAANTLRPFSFKVRFAKRKGWKRRRGGGHCAGVDPGVGRSRELGRRTSESMWRAKAGGCAAAGLEQFSRLAWAQEAGAESASSAPARWEAHRSTWGTSACACLQPPRNAGRTVSPRGQFRRRSFNPRAIRGTGRHREPKAQPLASTPARCGAHRIGASPSFVSDLQPPRDAGYTSPAGRRRGVSAFNPSATRGTV